MLVTHWGFSLPTHHTTVCLGQFTILLIIHSIVRIMWSSIVPLSRSITSPSNCQHWRSCEMIFYYIGTWNLFLFRCSQCGAVTDLQPAMKQCVSYLDNWYKSCDPVTSILTTGKNTIINCIMYAWLNVTPSSSPVAFNWGQHLFIVMF